MQADPPPRPPGITDLLNSVLVADLAMARANNDNNDASELSIEQASASPAGLSHEDMQDIMAGNLQGLSEEQRAAVARMQEGKHPAFGSAMARVLPPVHAARCSHHVLFLSPWVLVFWHARCM